MRPRRHESTKKNTEVNHFSCSCLRAFYVVGRCQALLQTFSFGIYTRIHWLLRMQPALSTPILSRVRFERESVTQRSPSIRAHTGLRGPQRLCSLNPDHGAAAPPSWRSRETTPQKPCVQRARDTATSPLDLR